MTLAARCPSCGTVFRVVQDQLRVSDGWVRCGRCGDVFNAVQNLVDLEVDVAVPRRPAAGEAPAGIADGPASAEPSNPTPGLAPADDDPPAESGFRIEDADAVAAPPEAADRATAAAPWDDGPAPRTETDAAPVDDGPAAAPDTASGAPTRPLQPPAGPADEPDPDTTGPDTVLEPAPTPAFVRHADAKARWRQPGVRAALGVACVAAAVGLAAQAAHEWRDLVAARWPAVRPLLEAMCHAPCRIAAPRDIDALSVESSGLVRVEGTSMYQLQVLLRNRSTLPLALPALDVTLSDTRGGVIARRVLMPEDAGVTASALQPAAELPVQATLTATGRPIAGYTIEIFYP